MKFVYQSKMLEPNNKPPQLSLSSDDHTKSISRNNVTNHQIMPLQRSTNVLYKARLSRKSTTSALLYIVKGSRNASTAMHQIGTREWGI